MTWKWKKDSDEQNPSPYQRWTGPPQNQKLTWKDPGPLGPEFISDDRDEDYELMGERVATECLQIGQKDEPVSLFRRVPVFFRKS